MPNSVNRNELEKLSKRLEAILNETVDGIVTISESGIVETFNKACEKIFGYKASEVIGQNVKILMPQPYRDQHDEYLSSYKHTGVAKIIGIGREVQGRRKDGTVFPVDLSVSEVSLQDQRLFSGIVRDITERKEAEKAIQQALESLRISNQELETFAYVASHDLKSPLRAIDNLTKWLEEDIADSLDEKNKKRMEKLRGRVARMEKLLDDLLEYSRAGSSINNFEVVSAALVVEEVWSVLDIPKQFQIEITPPMYEVVVPRVPLVQLFQNLIGNAVKHHHRQDGMVKVDVQEKDGFLMFSVADDGPGIPSKYHSKVFEMFQTLKPRDEVEGSGMGLALVKKILSRFGGRITLESEDGRGAKFIFAWPKNVRGAQQTGDTFRKGKA